MTMKITKSTYLLITAAVLIWGGFIYIVISDQKNDQELVKTDSWMAELKKEAKDKTDTFSLMLNYRDPFLGKNDVKPVVTNYTGPKNIIPAKAPVLPVVNHWPQIKFSGTIKNNKSNKTIALLTVNGQSLLLSQGDKFLEQFTLSKTTADSVEITLLKEKKIFKK
jgi:hypothetical protein